MVERRRRPAVGRVTNTAIMAEIIGDVIRISHSGKGSLMTGITVGRRAGVAGNVAEIAGSSCMLACQREARGIVIEGSRSPGSHGMAGCTVMADPALGVVGVGRIVKVGGVATVAISGYSLIAGGVAAYARDGAVSADERERSRVLIRGVGPGAGGGMVTRFAAGGKAGQQVIGIS